MNTHLQLLDCTLRDGSYAVDFRFTNEDTALLCGLLSRLGFKFIEIGHGFGINASNAGKGKMPSLDKELLEIAKSNVKDSKIGMFCIPKIAALENVKEMAQVGLDFIRIGNNAESIEEAFPYIEVARENNLYTMLNFMKSYAISPKEFAQKAKEAVKIGTQVIYLVDSAGGMFPEEIAKYIEEVKTAVDVKIGLHGHNNLHLATANAIQAVKSGASFIDTTLYGIGRSAGNVPSEVMLAILNNMGINIGVDLFELMNVADKYLTPLMGRIKMHDMLSVAMGAGKFHSSFFPQVKRVAEEYKTDVRKLVYITGKKDPSSVDEKWLRETAKSLGLVGSPKINYDITSFYSPKIRKDCISNTLKSVANLIEGLMNASAKGRQKIVMELVSTREPSENLVLAEYVVSDEEMVMGRVYFGSIKMLELVLGLIKDYVSLVLVDNAGGEWIDISDLRALAKKHIRREQIIPIKSIELRQTYLFEVLRIAIYQIGGQRLLVYGGSLDLHPILKMCADEFEAVYWFQLKADSKSELPKVVVLKNLDDWQDLDFRFDIILCLSNPIKKDAKILSQVLADNGKIISVNSAFDTGNEYFDACHTVSLDLNHAYRGLITRWSQAVNILRGEHELFGERY